MLLWGKKIVCTEITDGALYLLTQIDVRGMRHGLKTQAVIFNQSAPTILLFPAFWANITCFVGSNFNTPMTSKLKWRLPADIKMAGINWLYNLGLHVLYWNSFWKRAECMPFFQLMYFSSESHSCLHPFWNSCVLTCTVALRRGSTSS